MDPSRAVLSAREDEAHVTSPPGGAVLPHPSRSRRREGWAFGTSAIVHALLLLSVPECRDPAPHSPGDGALAAVELVKAPPATAPRRDVASADARPAQAEGATGGDDDADVPTDGVGQGVGQGVGDADATSASAPVGDDSRPQADGATVDDHDAADPRGAPTPDSADGVPALSASAAHASLDPTTAPLAAATPRAPASAADVASAAPGAAATTPASSAVDPRGVRPLPAEPSAGDRTVADAAADHDGEAAPVDADDALLPIDEPAPTSAASPLATPTTPTPSDLASPPEADALAAPGEVDLDDASASVAADDAPQVEVPPEVASLPPDAASLFAALAAVDRAAATALAAAPPPEPTPPAERWLTWARVSRSAAQVDAPSSALIAAWNVHVDVMAGSIVTADAEGPRRSGAAVNEPLPYQVGVEAPVRPPKEAMGESPTLTKPQPSPSGGGPATPGGGAGSRASPGERDGAPAATADPGDPGSAGAPGSAGSAGSPGRADGVAGSAGGAVWAPPSDPAGDWHPAVGRVRVVAAPRASTPASAAATPATPALAASAAVAPRAARPARPPRASKASPPTAPPSAAKEGPTPPTPTPDPVDWMDDLAELFGWGREPSDDYAPRLAEEGRQGSLATESTSPQTVVDDLDLTAAPAVSARQTPLGQYLEAVDDAVRERWRSFPLSPEQMAFGTTTFAAVEFTVLRSGRVEGIRLTRRSRDAVLDQLALAAIPKRLPRIPVEVGVDRVDHRIHLWYRSSTDPTP
jgi:TonB family protein